MKFDLRIEDFALLVRCDDGADDEPVPHGIDARTIDEAIAFAESKLCDSGCDVLLLERVYTDMSHRQVVSRYAWTWSKTMRQGETWEEACNEDGTYLTFVRVDELESRNVDGEITVEISLYNREWIKSEVRV